MERRHPAVDIPLTTKGGKGEMTKAPVSLQELRKRIYIKAKADKTWRFWGLYVHVCKSEVLQAAYEMAKQNNGAPGIDGVTFEAIEEMGREAFLEDIQNELLSGTYRPSRNRKKEIPKGGGKVRTLGIPTIRDRVAQMACVAVLGPVFEADLPPEQYAYRPQRSALDAVRRVHSLLNTGHTQVVDADLSGYFDSLPHTELMKSVARRISDRHVLHLIKMWLEMPVEEEDERGRKRRTTRNKDEHRGTPQGAPISPLLSNLYMRRFVLGWKQLGHEQRLRAFLVNYADDFVICCRGTAQQATTAMRNMMARLKLTVNEAKTRICRVPDEAFDFLGYTIGRCYSTQTGRSYIGTRPSRKRIARLCQAVSEMTQRRWLGLDVQERVTHLNRMLVGWANYFCLGPVSRAYRAIDAHVRHRLRWWLCGKHKVAGRGTARYPDEYLYDVLGLVRLERCTRRLPWAKA